LVPGGDDFVLHVEHLMLNKLASLVSEQRPTIIGKAGKVIQLAHFVFNGVAGSLLGT